MFTDRMREDQVFASARTGLFDAVLERIGDWRCSRMARVLLGKRFFPGRELTFRLGHVAVRRYLSG